MRGLQLKAVLLIGALLGPLPPRALELCSVPQTYQALEAVRRFAQPRFETFYAPPGDLYARLANSSRGCDVVITSDERLSLLLIRSGKVRPQSRRPFLRVPLILWSADESLLDARGLAFKQKKLRSLALPDARLTPVGYAAHEIAAHQGFPTEYLKNRIYRAPQEFAVYAMVRDGNVQAGFVSKPLIMNDGEISGSYYEFPRADYQDIIYYIMITEQAESPADAQNLLRYITEDIKALASFKNNGFEEF